MTTELPDSHSNTPASVWVLPLEAAANAARMVRAFGRTAAQAAAAFAAFGAAAKKMKEEEKELCASLQAKRPWYRRGRW